MAPDGRRTKGEGSLYQREKDGRWVGVIDLGWVGGKRVRKTVTAKTKRELVPKFKALQKQIDSGIVTEQATVERWLNYWLTDIAPARVRPRTLMGYRSYVDTWLIPHLGKRKLIDLKPDHVRALHRVMEDAGKSDATRRQCHMILRRALVVAEREGRVARNVATLLDPPKVGTTRHDHLSPAEARLVIAHALDVSDRARLMVSMLMALRQGEALGLRWEDVDLHEDVAYVHQAITRQKGAGLVLGPVKSDASKRYVPIIAPVAQTLREYRSLVGSSGYVFGGDKPTDPRRDWQMWKDALSRAGVKDVPLHGARATCASLLDELQVSPRIIADILGHAQVNTTQTHYIRSRDSQRRDALESVGRFVLAPEATQVAD